MQPEVGRFAFQMLLVRKMQRRVPSARRRGLVRRVPRIAPRDQLILCAASTHSDMNLHLHAFQPVSSAFITLLSHLHLTVNSMPVGANYSTLLVSIGVATLIYFVASKMFGHDPREPPLAPQSIPIVGHMLGLSRSKFNYYVDLRYYSPLLK